MSEKIIRDPVHDVIALRIDEPLDSLLFRLINASEFQRLRRIRQLGLASLAYPGADHSRYSHSLGVMETARKMLNHLRRSITIGAEDEMLCLAGALLHDLGHGPFSHVFERVSGIHHEDATRRVILDPQSEVHRVLASVDGTFAQRVVDFISGAGPRTFFHDIISSNLDADRCDYLLHNNLMTGSQYGNYDLNWLLKAIAVDTEGKRLVVTAKGISALEAYLQSRYHMYRNVYFHKVVRGAEGMIRLALQRARRLAVQERLSWPGREHAVYKCLLGQTPSAGEFTMLDDSSMLECLKAWSMGEDAVLASLCRGLLSRRLFKVVELTQVSSGETLEKIRAAALEVVAEAGGDAAYDLFYDQASDTPFQPKFSTADDPIYVINARGRLADFSTISPLGAALNRQLDFHRLHIQPYLKPEIEARIGGMIDG